MPTDKKLTKKIVPKKLSNNKDLIIIKIVYILEITKSLQKSKKYEKFFA